MVKRKKRQLHCDRCGSPVETYRKGKAHRVLVCPTHGVIAWNPFRLSSAIEGAVSGAAVGSVVPGVGTGIGAVAGGLLSGFEKAAPAAAHPRVACGNRYTTEERVADALRS